MSTKKEHKSFFKKLIKFFTYVLVILIILFLYAFYIGPTGIFIKEYKVKNKKITDNFYGFKIVQISDIHYGRTVMKKELNTIVKKVNETKPDIVLLTGDLIDMDTRLDDNMKHDIETELSKIDASVGRYAITGNHDTMFEDWESIIDNAGFKNLNDTYETIYYEDNKNYILLSGLSSITNKKKDLKEKLEPSSNFMKDLKPGEEPCYKILMIHEPDIIDDFDYKDYDLIVGGHTHKGQINIPGIKPLLLPGYGRKYYKDYYKLNDTDIYISSGIGTSKLNVRLFNRPSFNLYRLVNK